MHPEEVAALNSLLEQERTLRKLVDETKRTRNYSLGVERFTHWVSRTRRVVVDHITEASGREFYSDRMSYADTLNPSVYYSSQVKTMGEKLGALIHTVKETGLHSFRSLPKMDASGKYENEQVQIAHIGIRKHLNELIHYEMEYYEDENQYQRAYQRLIRWEQRTSEMLVRSVTRQEAELFAKEVREIDSAVDKFEVGKAFLIALLETIHSYPEQVFINVGGASKAERTTSMTDNKPRMFIGSSIEGLEVAETIQLGLRHSVDVVIWNQGPFGLSEGTLESLVNAKDSFDYAVFVLTPDDLVTKRGRTGNSPRDNVLFELGLFIGALGRKHTFMVRCSDDQLDLPTDLAGITRHSIDNLDASLGPVCTLIKRAIQQNQSQVG